LLQIFNELLTGHMNEAQILAMVSKSEEFNQVKVSSNNLSGYAWT